GDTITWTITIKNTGDTPLDLVEVVDNGATFVVPAACNSLAANDGAPGGLDECSFTATHLVTPAEGLLETYSNTVVVHYDLPASYNLGNDITDSDTFVTELLHPNFTLTKKCAEEPLTGDDQFAVFNITLKNTGDVDLIVTLDEDVKDGLVTIPAGTPIELKVGVTKTYTVEKPIPPYEPGKPWEVSNSITATATLPEWTGLDNVLTRNSSDACTVKYYAYTPGFWKNHGPDAPSGHDAWVYTDYETIDRLGDVFDLNTLLESCTYPKGMDTKYENLTLLQALSLRGGKDYCGSVEILLRAGTAALLNASINENLAGVVPGMGYYPYTVAQVINLVNAALASGNRTTIITLASQFDMANNGGWEYFDWGWPVPGP
ncbi:MAG: hypothetical protein H6Q38_2042, partial [Chloroflexi bacterium]|nr:hypothetical protein [Chloroflexota bacterium]